MVCSTLSTPEHLDAWQDDDRRSRIVFIGRGFDGGELERSLAVFNRLSEAMARRHPLRVRTARSRAAVV